MNTTVAALTGALMMAGAIAAAPPAVPTAESGKVVVLTTEQLLEGDITCVGNQYRIRRSIGETVIPASQVLKLVGDRKEAYEVIRKRSNPRDPDERLRVARWCLLYGLREQALVEAEAALKLRPTDADIQTMVDGLHRLQAAPQPPPAPPAADRVIGAVEDVPPAPEFNTAAYGMFVSKIQPLLMNACASCHAGGKGGTFKLTRVYSGSNNRRGTLLNLNATLGQINRERPQTSPILQRSLAVHGEAARAPIANAAAPAYQLLERWAQFALAAEGTSSPEELPNRNESTEELASGVAVSRRQPKPLPKPPRLPGPRKENSETAKGRLLGYQNGIFRESPASTEPMVEQREADGAKTAPRPATPSTGFAEASKTKSPAMREAPPADEFDPVIFNNLGKKQ